MSFLKIKTENLSEDENDCNKSWLDEMAEELENYEFGKIKENFKSNCDNATFDFGFKEEFGIVKQELDETTNDSVKSASSDSRKSERKTAFKRKAPYDCPPPPIISKPTEETSTSTNDWSVTSKSPSTFFLNYDVPPPPIISKPVEETSTSTKGCKKKKKEYETDPVILKRRQKQIDFGKNTIGYDTYTKKVARKERGKEDPVTPKKHLKYSRRAWDGLIRQWRLRLHNYDP